MPLHEDIKALRKRFKAPRNETTAPAQIEALTAAGLAGVAAEATALATVLVDVAAAAVVAGTAVASASEAR